MSRASSTAKRSGRSSRHHTRRPEGMATAEELIKSAQDRMVKSVEHARAEFATVRTGRASASLLDRTGVDYYGTQPPLRQPSTITVPEPRTLTPPPVDPRS